MTGWAVATTNLGTLSEFALDSTPGIIEELDFHTKVSAVEKKR
jgi:hypothetical protein